LAGLPLTGILAKSGKARTTCLSIFHYFYRLYFLEETGLKTVVFEAEKIGRQGAAYPPRPVMPSVTPVRRFCLD
jgi:hypothetical protein